MAPQRFACGRGRMYVGRVFSGDPLRVAYILNNYPAVSHSFIRREILALERQGVAVVRIAMRGWDDAGAEFAEGSGERDRTHYVLKDGPSPLITATFWALKTRPRAFLSALRAALRLGRRAVRPLPFHLIYLAEACWIARFLDGETVDHVHAHFGTNPAEVAMLVHLLGGPRWSFTTHGPEEFDKPAFLKLPEKIGDSAFVVGISSFTRSQLYRLVPHGEWHKVKVVHCGLEAAFHDGAPDEPGSRPRLVCVGRICEQKGHLILIEAARMLRSEGISFELVLAGDGDMRSEIERLVSAYDLSDCVSITGWIDSARVRDEILAARALVLPSFAEGLPVVLMEALALGRPVISTYIAGIPELVRPGFEGWLVPAGDREALAAAMRECLSRPAEDLAAMGRSGRSRVLDRHSIDTEAAKLARHFAASQTDSGSD